ncbi:hypothetical protein J5X07_12330 [Actinomyces bowdenii]|nr:hypothetical protein [Actinomyces bowdenii]
MRGVIEEDRAIASVAASCELVPQTVGIWVAKLKKERGNAEERQAATEAAEIACLKKQVRELQQGCEFLKKGVPRRWGAAWVCR